jgi:hypothetical protein
MRRAAAGLKAPSSRYGGAAGLVSGPEQVEYRAHAHGTPHRAERLHRRMKVGREQERVAGGLEAGDRRVLVGRQAHADGFQHVGAAAAARDAAIAVLDDGDAAGRGEQRGAGGQVQAAGAVAAGAHDVEQRPRGVNGRLARQAAHRLRETAHFGRRLALGAQRGQQGGGHRRRKFLARQLDQQRGGLFLREIDAAEQLLQGGRQCAHVALPAVA